MRGNYCARIEDPFGYVPVFWGEMGIKDGSKY